MNPTIEEIKAEMIAVISEELDVDQKSIDQKKTFHQMGLDSLSSVFMLNELEEKYNVELKPMHLWNNPDLDSLAHFVHDLIHASK